MMGKIRLLIGAAMLVVPIGARAEWREAKTPHFLIYSQGSDKSLHKFAERLESVHALMLMATGTREEAHPYRVRVYIVAGTKAVQSYMEKRDSDVAGFYRPLLSGPVAITPGSTGNEDTSFSAQVVLFHEYAHHFMLQFFPSVYPAWYVEGWAELVSTASFEKPGVISYGKVADHRRYELDLAQHIEASRLVTKRQKDLNADEKTRFYGSSWLLAHYLTFSAERQGQLARYLAAINTGASPTEAAKVFGDLRTLDRDVDRYLGAARFSYRQPPIPPEIAGHVELRVLAPDEAAMLPLTIESTKPMDEAEAKAFAARVEAAATPFPSGAAAHRLVAQVDLAAGFPDRARAAAARAVALAPQDARARYYLGAAALEQAEKGPDDKRVAAVVAARKDIVAANRLDPDDPMPLIAYYRSYGAAHQAAPDAARAALAKAAEIVPQDSGTRLSYVYDLIVHGDKVRAALMLRPLAYDVHGGGGASTALKMLDILEGRAKGDPLQVPPDEPKPAVGKSD